MTTQRPIDGKKRINKSEQTSQSTIRKAGQEKKRMGKAAGDILHWKGNKVSIVSAPQLLFCFFFVFLDHALAVSSESQLASTRPGGVACLREVNLVAVPGMPNCAPFKSTNGAMETASSDGAGDGVNEAGSTATVNSA